MKISFGMIVLNGEPFIKYNLENLYPHAHEILIVEGAVEKFKHAATPDGHSIDNTVEIIKGFPGPEGKIKLIQRDGFWPEKDEMSNAYMKACTGDYIWQVDADEFYKGEDISKLKYILSKNPDISRVDIKSITFWRSFHAVMQGATYIYGADEFIRIFKFRPGYRYLTHRPPTLLDEKGELVSHKKIITAKELAEKHGVVMYHYAYVFPEYVRTKAKYYSEMNWGQGHEDGLTWFHNEWEKFSNPLRVHIIKYPPSWVISFNRDHPEVIKRMILEHAFKEDPVVNSYLKNAYKKYQKAGERLSDIILKYSYGQIGKVKAFLKCLLNLFLPFCARNRKANSSIIMVAMKIWRNKVVG